MQDFKYMKGASDLTGTEGAVKDSRKRDENAEIFGPFPNKGLLGEVKVR